MTDVKDMSFEEAIGQLEELVRKLEEGNLDLDRSLEIYEQAVELRERCRSILEESERKVQKLIATANGIAREDFKVDRA